MKLLDVHPRLPVSDLNRTADFYSEHFGFSCSFWPEEPPTFVILEKNDVNIQFYAADAESGEATGNATLSFKTDDATAVHRELEKKMTIEWGPEVYWYGRREFAVRDPDGTLLIFTEPTDDPPTCLDE